MCASIVATVAASSVCGGIAHAESPECTPASSMCSITPPIDDVAGARRGARRRRPRPRPRGSGRSSAGARPTARPRARAMPCGGELGHRARERVVVVDDLHGAPAEHVRRAHEHRDSRGRSAIAPRASAVGRGAARRLRDAEPLAQRVEALAVLGEVDRVGARAEHRDARRFERVRELQRRLPAERDDHARRAAAPVARSCSASQTLRTSSVVSGSKKRRSLVS